MENVVFIFLCVCGFFGTPIVLIFLFCFDFFPCLAVIAIWIGILLTLYKFDVTGRFLYRNGYYHLLYCHYPLRVFSVINIVLAIMLIFFGSKAIDYVGTEYRRMMQEASKPAEEREYERIVLRLNDEMAKIEERLRECNDIEQLLSNDYSAAYKDYAAINDEEGRKILFDELKITKKRQLALPKYREECEVMTGRIRSLLRRLDQEQMIPANIANVYEDINKTIQSLFAGNFFDFATRHDISDAEVERLITAP